MILMGQCINIIVESWFQQEAHTMILHVHLCTKKELSQTHWYIYGADTKPMQGIHVSTFPGPMQAHWLSVQ
jgi:hypothetical protein